MILKFRTIFVHDICIQKKHGWLNLHANVTQHAHGCSTVHNNTSIFYLFMRHEVIVIWAGKYTWKHILGSSKMVVCPLLQCYLHTIKMDWEWHVLFAGLFLITCGSNKLCHYPDRLFLTLPTTHIFMTYSGHANPHPYLTFWHFVSHIPQLESVSKRWL